MPKEQRYMGSSSLGSLRYMKQADKISSSFVLGGNFKGYISKAVNENFNPKVMAQEIAQDGALGVASVLAKKVPILNVGMKVLEKVGERGLPQISRSVEVPVAKGQNFTYRGDSRSPSEIFEYGFKPRGTSTDLQAHALRNTDPPSIYVPTSKSANVASEFADNVYVVRPQNGIDVNATLGSRSPFPDELEIAIPGGVSPSDIRAVTQGNVSILNPGYKP